MGAIGCGLVGFGPVGILFFLIVAGDPLQVILFTLRYVNFILIYMLNSGKIRGDVFYLSFYSGCIDMYINQLSQQLI